MNLLYPKLKRSQLPAMTGIALIGGLAGGVYGVFHDLFTYSISSEYFTRLKFAQFSHADFGFPPRIFAAEVGFIAAGAVGLAAGWFLARAAIPAWPPRTAFRKVLEAFRIVIVTALTATAVGYFIGLNHDSDVSSWKDFCEPLGISDIQAFVRVAYIHNASYIGGLLGLILAILSLRRAIKGIRK